jgi:hypothetical protein
MSAKGLANWSGVVSIAWMLGGYYSLSFIIVPRDWRFDPEWLFLLLVLFGWMGVGLLLAMFGLRRGSVAGRICSVTALGVVLYFAWFVWLSPAVTHARQRGMRPAAASEASVITVA